MELHLIRVEGPLSYPGVGDGLFTASCTRGDWSSGFGTEEGVCAAGGQHASTRNAVEANLVRFDQDTVDRVTLRLAVEFAVGQVRPAGTVLAAINNCRRDVDLEPISEQTLAPLRRWGYRMEPSDGRQLPPAT